MPPYHYVYILQSESTPAHYYTGRTDNLRARPAKHNEGGNPHTADHRPWSIKNAFAFLEAEKAAAFEHYLKSPSGRAFSKRHL